MPTCSGGLYWGTIWKQYFLVRFLSLCRIKLTCCAKSVIIFFPTFSAFFIHILPTRKSQIPLLICSNTCQIFLIWSYVSAWSCNHISDSGWDVCAASNESVLSISATWYLGYSGLFFIYLGIYILCFISCLLLLHLIVNAWTILVPSAAYV